MHVTANAAEVAQTEAPHVLSVPVSLHTHPTDLALHCAW